MAITIDKILGKPLSHKHRVGDLVATGTASDSTFLRGDGEWATSGGGGDLVSTNNLSDLADAATARTNLGLGTAATVDTGTASGEIPVLDGSGKLNISLLPGLALTDTFVVADQTAMLALSAETGDVAVRTDVNKSFILKGASASTLADWQELLTPTDSVHSVFGRQGTVTAQTNDYTWAQINKTTSSLADIATRSYNDLQNLPTLGTLASQNGTFSGGGTLATGGFTLTVPATGTVALLGTANVFTANQTIQVDTPIQIFNNTNTAGYSSFRFNESGTVMGAVQAIGTAFATTSRRNNIEFFNHTLTGDFTFHLKGSATPSVVLTQDGNVGIGTTSPAYKLDVNGTLKASTSLIEHTTTGINYQLIINNASTNSTARAGFQMTRAGDSGTSTARGSALFTTDTLFGFADYEARSMTIYTGASVGTNSARLVVSPEGKVGIGTTSPVGNFDAVLDGNGGIFRRFGGSPSMVFERANGTISSPTQVNSATTIGAFSAQAYDNTGVYRSVGLIRFNSTAAVTSTSSPGSISFQTTPSGSTTASDRMTIDSTGNVGIGTTSPATSGLLDLTSTTKALIVTRMTTAQRDALTAVDGMILYNTTTGGFQGRAGGAWVNL